jgi:hypothetical protein
VDQPVLHYQLTVVAIITFSRRLLARYWAVVMVMVV